MKTKIFSAFFIFFLCLAAVGAVNASADTYGDLTYTVSGNTITITGCNKSAADVVIPSKIKGRTVTSIGRGAFSDCTSLTSVKIPDSVTSIGDVAFYGCSLTSITIPGSVTSVGLNAFFDCENLERVDITDLAAWCKMSLGDNNNPPFSCEYDLYLNGELVENLVIPDGVASIGRNAFYLCTGLASITIPDSLTSIGRYAFSGCSSLMGITIPDSVTSIGGSAFYGCSSLTSITIPGSVTSIGKGTFGDCSSLTGITIPGSVTSIGDSAFCYCKNLAKVTIPDSVTIIGDYAFKDCQKLTSVTIPDGLNIIPKSAFSYCINLKAITIPASMEYIRNDAFSGCDNIKYVFFKGSRDFWDNEMLIYTGNDALNNAEIICGAKEKTYKFVTNCEKTLSPVTAFYIAGAPNTETLSRKKYVTGWYDNPELSGKPIEFPYYSDKTTLYAKLADRTGGSFESAVYVPENGSSTINKNIDNKYWTFIPEKTGEYIFESTSDDGLYLYNSNKAKLASGSNSITFSLAAGEVYYIMNTYMYSTGGTLTVTQADYKGTSTAISNNGKNIRVVPTDVETGTKITVALYNGDKFVGTKVATYRGGAIEFTTNTEYTTIKVMAWDADNLTPCAKAEVVER